MKVSVLIPYYNDKKYLSIAIESVLNQSFRDFELILVNHATTDESREIAHSYSDSRIIHIDMEKNYGAGTGLIMKKFLEIAKGEYVKPFCADDVMHPNCLADLVEYMDKNSEIDFAFGNVEYIDKESNSKKKNWFESRYAFSTNNDEIDCLKLFYNGIGFLPYIGSIITKKAMQSIDIDVSFMALFDMSIWLKLLIKKYKIGYLDKIVAGYRIHENQLTSLSNERKIFACCDFEFLEFGRLFFEINDENIIKKVFKNNIYIEKINEWNDLDKNFILAYELFRSDVYLHRVVGYSTLYGFIQNSKTRKYLEEKFNFGIREFRSIYSAYDIKPKCNYKKISLKEIFYILFKKIAAVIAIKDLKRFSKKRESL